MVSYALLNTAMHAHMHPEVNSYYTSHQSAPLSTIVIYFLIHMEYLGDDNNCVWKDQRSVCYASGVSKECVMPQTMWFYPFQSVGLL